MDSPVSATRHLEKLVAHLEWADGLVLDGLRTSPGTDTAALEYFAHILAAEHVWLTRVQGREASYKVWPTLSLDECAELARENARGWREIVTRLDPNELDRKIAYTNSAGRSFVDGFEDIFFHVALHGAYHRGQISLMTRRSGGTPAPTDYIAYVRGVPTATRADAERREGALPSGSTRG
jgi:uncharacterized damage-inducible protein DinB